MYISLVNTENTENRLLNMLLSLTLHSIDIVILDSECLFRTPAIKLL